MTKRFLFLLAISALASGLADTAWADETTSSTPAAVPVASNPMLPVLTFNVAGTTDYEFRGVSQTDNEAALQGGADATLGLFYAGVWASNVKFAGDKADVEVDTYGGVRPTLGGVALDFGALHYGYLGEASGVQDDYWEFKGAASKSFGRFTSGVAVYYSPDFFAGTDTAWYYEVNGAFAVTPRLSVSGAVGRQDVSYAGDYTTWNIGAAYAITDHASIDLRYWDTDEHRFGDIYSSRIVATLKGTF